MDTKALKDKILQLAIQGKLVPQEENDEPASVLLERIKKEKDELINKKIIKKEKSFPDITDDEKLFELPNGWEWCRLGKIFNIVRGSSPRPKGHPMYFTENKTDYKWVTIKDITQFSKNNLLYKTNEYLTYEGSLKSRFIKKGEIIIAVSGSIGKTAIMDIDGYIYDGLAGLKNIIESETLVKYIYYILTTWKENLNNISEGTSIQNINTDKLNNLLIALPPLEEQKRIVAKVDSLFKLIDELDSNKQDLLQNISDTRNKVLQLAIEGKLVTQDENDEPASALLERIKNEKEQLIKNKVIKKEKLLPEITNEEKLFEVPNGWGWCRLGEISFKITDGSHNPPKGEENYTEYIMLSSQNINNNGLVNLEKSRFLSKHNYEIENKRTNVNKGDILLTIVGTIGRSCIYTNELKITLQRSVGVIDT
ncbi:MAG: restriction endonuclease subunit S, partial [Clostridium perfringens]|nr:restriction endonuclease subunit S [Clostridium perfringens]